MVQHGSSSNKDGPPELEINDGNSDVLSRSANPVNLISTNKETGGPATNIPLETPNETHTNIETKLGNLVKDAEFFFADGNLQVSANKRRLFHIHAFKLEEFLSLKPNIKSYHTSSRIFEMPDDPDDLHNTFRVIYSCSYLWKPLDFDTPVLVSALRLATKYNNPELRMFACQKLIHKPALPIDFFSWGREFNLVRWEAWATDQLALRPESITLEEGRILGVETLVKLGARRDKGIWNAQQTIAPPNISSDPMALLSLKTWLSSVPHPLELTIEDPANSEIENQGSKYEHPPNMDDSMLHGDNHCERPTKRLKAAGVLS